MKTGSLAATLVAGVSIFAAGISMAAEVRVSSIPFKAPLDRIAPQFQRATGHRLVVKYAPAGPLRKQIESGELFDVVLIFPEIVDELMKQGKLVPGSRLDIARAGLGLAVKNGAAKPDIQTPDAFKRALIAATSIAYAAQGPSGIHLLRLLERLDIAQDVRPKLRPMGAGSLVVGPVASGEVEMGIVSIPFILGEPGAELAGPLPRELQDYVRYTSGISSAAQHLSAAKEFVGYFRRPEAIEALKSNGLEVPEAP